MLKGTIRSMDIIRHPWTLVRLYGMFEYVRLLGKCVSPATYLFLNIMPK